MKKQIYLLLTIVLLVTGWAGAVTNDFYFVQVTDTHFGTPKHITSLKKIVTYINNLPMDIEFVVITGDLTSENIENREIMMEGTDILKQLKAPLHVLPGNHDIRPQNKDVMAKLFKKYFGKAFYSVQHHGVDCIFWYDEPYHSTGLDFKDYKPLEWLEQSLNEAQGKAVLLFLHTPPAPDFYGNTFHDSWPAPNIEEFTTLISAYPVQGVFAGHYHRAELHWLGNIPLFVAPSVATYWKRQPSYRIYHYQDGKLSFFTQYIE